MEDLDKKINIRSTLLNMGIESSYEFKRSVYKPLSIRSTAAMIRENTGQSYTVSVHDDKITVRRLS